MLSALLAAELRVARVDSLIVELDEFSVVHFVRIVVDVSKVEALLIVFSGHPDDAIVLALLSSNFFVMFCTFKQLPFPLILFPGRFVDLPYLTMHLKIPEPILRG